MATVKSILDIDINDKPFNDFLKKFEKYSKAVKTADSDWKKIATAMGTSGEELAKLGALSATMSKNTVEAGKGVTAMDRGFRKAADSVRSLMFPLRAAGGVISTMAVGAARVMNLLKWGTLIGGVAAFGGFWGVDRLGMSAAGSRRAAMGMGTSPGSMQAFRVNYSRYLDPESNLANIASARSDLSRRWAFAAMGIQNPDAHDTVDLATQMAVRARRLFIQGGGTEQAAQAHGLLEFYSMEDLKRLQKTSEEDLLRSQGSTNRDRNTFAVNDETGRRWQEFVTQIERAGQQIETVFVKGLVNLSEPLSRLSSSIANALEGFLGNPRMGSFIDSIGKGIEQFAKYIGSDSFREDVGGFVSGLSSMVSALRAAVDWIAGITGHKAGTVGIGGYRYGAFGEPLGHMSSDLWAGFGRYAEVGQIPYVPGIGGYSPALFAPKAVPGPGPLDPDARPDPHTNPGNLKDIYGRFMRFASREEGIRAMAERIKGYQTGWRKNKTLAQIITTYAPPSENDTAAYIANMRKMTGVDPNQEIDLSSNPVLLSQIIAAMLKLEGLRGKPIPPEMILKILNNTGGSAQVSTNQLAQ